MDNKFNAEPSTTYEEKTYCGPLYLTCKGQPVKSIVITLGKCGCCSRATLEAVGRLLTIGLRRKVAIEEMMKTLAGIQCHLGGDKNCVHVVSELLREHLKESS